MFFTRAFFASLALVSCASASTTPVAFTSVPAVVVGGQSYNITWGGGDDTPVTITLRQGNPDNLNTIGVLADGVEGDSYLWKVSSSLPSADDYALQITQGQNEINYSGLFSVVSANDAKSTSTMSAGASASASMSPNLSVTTAIGLTSNGTATRNSTMSTSSISRTITTTAATSMHSPAASHTTTPAEATSALNSGAVQMTSSAALAVGILAAVMFLS